MEGLKKCPFCGGEAKVSVTEEARRWRVWYVKCRKCHARTDGYYEPDDLDDEINPYGKITETVEDAVRLWNRRADDGQEA